MSSTKIVELIGERTVIYLKDAFPEPGVLPYSSRKGSEKLPGGNLLHKVAEFVSGGAQYTLGEGDIILYRIGRGKEVISRRWDQREIPGGMVLVSIYSQSSNTHYKIVTTHSRSDHTLDDRIE